MESLNPEQFDFDHPVTEIRLLQTHISWVLLTGQWAYKIKKPVRFEFVDYSTLEHRQRYCQRELELNHRFAPQLYDSVVPISHRPENDRYRVGDRGNIVEYAVKMRQFDQNDLLPAAIAAGRVHLDQMEEFAKSLARFHLKAESLEASHRDRYLDRVYHDAQENLETIRQLWPDVEGGFWFRSLVDWTHAEYRMLRNELASRIEQGHVRCCHGDMHCGNIVLFQDRLIPFDGIEFNDDLIWIDTINELAFPTMDLSVRGFPALAHRLMNGYLESTTDYAGARLLPFFQVYRALVRAKVAGLNPEYESLRQRGPLADDAPWAPYLKWALQRIRPHQPFLAITSGISGSGKSHAALQIADRTGAVRVRSDVLRRAMQIDSPEQRYAPVTTERVYRRMHDIARGLLEVGVSVVADATFLKRDQRRRFAELANEMGVAFHLVALDPPWSVIQQRLASRQDDPSEATIEVALSQMKTRDPIADDERAHIISAEDLTRRQVQAPA